MAVIITNSYSLTLAEQGEAWKPIIGWQNYVTFNGVSADFENANYLATNLANPATNLIWKSTSTVTQYVTALFSSVQIDYVGIARHNLASIAATISIEALPIGGDPNVSGDWVEVVSGSILAKDEPSIFRFPLEYYIGARIKIVSATANPQIGVFYAGKLLILPCGIPVGHSPISKSKNMNIITPRSQSGDFLGRIILQGRLSTTIEQRYIDGTVYRSDFEPFILATPNSTFFFAWSPEDYPDEIGYCWTTSDIIPQISSSTGFIDVSFDIEGISS